jgi:hypothetical protein
VRGFAIVENSLQFFHELGFDLGMQSKEVAGPGESDGGGFVAGEKKGHHFIAQLHVAHGIAVGVACLQERIEQISARLIAGAALADDAIDDAVEIADGAAPRGREEARKVKREKQGLAGVAHEAVGDHLHGFADALGSAGDVCAKQALADNFKRNGHHVFVNVAGFAGGPGIEHAAGSAGDDRRIRQDIFAAESRLDEAALALPRFSFVGEQTIPEDAGESAVVCGFGEVAGIADQDVFDFARMHEQADGNVDIAKVYDVAVFFGAAGIESEPVPGNSGEIAKEEMAFGAGRGFERKLGDEWGGCGHGWVPGSLVGLVTGRSVARKNPQRLLNGALECFENCIVGWLAAKTEILAAR